MDSPKAVEMHIKCCSQVLQGIAQFEYVSKEL